MISVIILGCLLVTARAEIEGWVTGFHLMRFYADGIEHVYSGGWSTANAVTLPDYTEVLAFECQTSSTFGGVKGWFSNGIKTDGSWTCTNTYHLGWSSPGYDDSGIDWEPATVISSPEVLDVVHNAPAQLAGRASWIWTKAYYQGERKVYCRRKLHNGVARQFGGEATCDNRMSLFCDGVQVAYNNDWTKSTKVTCPWNTRVIGISCRDVGHQGGIKAAFNNGVKTDASWKCSTELDKDWLKASFDDSAWVNATIVNDEVTTKVWGNRPETLDDQTYWIWTEGYRMQDPIVYCRITLTPGKTPEPMPDNGCSNYFNNWANGGGTSTGSSTSGGSGAGGGSCNVDTAGLLNDIRSAIGDSNDNLQKATDKSFKDLDKKLDTIPEASDEKIDKIVNALSCTCPSKRR